MATWQEGSGAGFLAGIGRQNDNAPNAGDNALSLDLIRQNNDIQRSGANNAGLQALQGLAGFADTVRQADLAKATQQFNQVHANAWATGDNSGLVKFAQQNPAFVAQAQQAVSGLDAQQKQELGSLAMQTNTALAQGPQAYSQFINANSDRLKRVGADPGWMLQTGINNPEQLSHLTTTMVLGAVGPDKMLDYQDKILGRGIEQQNANTSTFSAQQNARQGDERLTLDRYKAQTGNQLAAEELRLRALLGKAQNDTARANLQQKLDTLTRARDEKINSVVGNVSDFGRAITVGNDLGALVNQHPTAVSRNQGGSLGWLPNWADDTRTLASKTDEYNTKVILPALKGTFGSNPTEGERAALMQSSNNLKKATSNEDFLKELNRAQDTIVQMQKRQIRGLGIPVTKSQDEATDTQMLLSDPSLVEEYIRAHGYLPESYYQAQLKGAN